MTSIATTEIQPSPAPTETLWVRHIKRSEFRWIASPAPRNPTIIKVAAEVVKSIKS